MITDMKVNKYKKFEKNSINLKAQGYEDAIRDRALDLISKQQKHRVIRNLQVLQKI